MATHIVSASGGKGSWAAGRRVAERMQPGDHLVLLFADTNMEDEDLYRFLDDSAANTLANLPAGTSGQFVRLADGRDVWQVFFDKRFLGNTRIDPCSKILKRDIIRRWIEDNYAPGEAIVYLGIDWSEDHRFEKAKPYWQPYRVEAPLCEAPYLSGEGVLAWLKREGIEPPRLYALGFPHNNCGGFCVKGGQASFKLLLRQMPARYAYHERREQELREYLGKDVAILRDRRGGKTRPMTLREFRERIEAEAIVVDEFDLGGCACFTPDAYANDELERQRPTQLGLPGLRVA